MSDVPDDEPTADTPQTTLYRKVGKGQRRLTPARMLMYRVAVVVGWWVVRAFWATCRIHRVIGMDAARATAFASKSVIPVYWHQDILFGVRALLDLRTAGLKIGFLISPSVDGTAPALLVEKIGGHVIRGSSSHTGARALRDFYETIVKQQVSPAITPDGPRGPALEFKPGAIVLSQITGKPILPIAVASSRSYTFKTWDRFELPLPFSRVVLAYGEPVKVPRAMGADGLATTQAEMTGRMLALKQQARQALLEPPQS
jgi:lysophospholipid acyltransferase (LPLAT)-like uncharacterized protein